MHAIRLVAVSALESRPIAETLLGLHRAGMELEVVAPGTAPYAHLLREADCALIETYPGLDRRAVLVARERLRRRAAELFYLEGLSCPPSMFLAAVGLPARIAVRLCYLESPHRRMATGLRLLCRLPKVERVIWDVDPSEVEDPPTGRWLAGKSVALPLPHDPDWYADETDLKAFGIPTGAFSVAAVTDGLGQGMEWLINCARELPMDLPIHFLLIAPESTHDRLRRSIRKIPFTQRFHVSDAIEAAPAVMARCSVFVVTAWEVEIQRRTCMQCLAAGVPVLGGNEPALKQVVRPGVSGELLPAGDTQALAHLLFELYENSAQRDALSAGASRLSEEVPSVEDAVTGLVATFREILSAHDERNRP